MPLTGDAVVIGAGIAGLAAARVLSDRFDRVTVLDRDRLPAGADSRRGVPQGSQAHVLLAVGREALEKLFPGLTEELVGRGACWIDIGRDALTWQLDGYRIRAETGVSIISLSRPLLELCVRQRVRVRPNVVIRADAAVAGLTGQPGQRVQGVELADGTRLPADLVVDASGRGGRGGRWLSELGFPAPAESGVTVRVGYTTRLLRRKPGELAGNPLVLVAESPPDRQRFGIVFPIEDDRWLVTLGGFHGEHAPTDPEGYQRFAESLPDQHIADLMRRAEPLTEPVAHQYPASRRRGFERLSLVPAGYLAIGDALCSFNPVYGHGMTVASVEAITLGECLDRHRSTDAAMARDFYREAGKIVDVAWDMAIAADFAYAGTEGRRPRGFTFSNWYLRQVILATHVSPTVLAAILRVQHLLDPGSILLRPPMLAKVLWAARRARRAINS